MAFQAGMGVSRIILIAGAGYGTLLFKNGKLSDVLADIQALVGDGSKKETSDDAITAQILRLAEEVRRMSGRPITVLNGNSVGNLTNIVVPAATLGAMGYGYMWYKGIKFSDLMYVTKRGMATAVANLTKHLEHVSDALAEYLKIAGSLKPSLTGLKEFADPSSPNGGITDCISQDLVEKPSLMPRMLTRTASSKC